MNINSFNNSSNNMQVCIHAEQPRQNKIEHINNKCSDDDDMNNMNNMSMDQSMFQFEQNHHQSKINPVQLPNNSKSIQPYQSLHNDMEYSSNAPFTTKINTSGGSVIQFNTQSQQFNNSVESYATYINNNYYNNQNQTQNYTQNYPRNYWNHHRQNNGRSYGHNYRQNNGRNYEDNNWHSNVHNNGHNYEDNNGRKYRQNQKWYQNNNKQDVQYNSYRKSEKNYNTGENYNKWNNHNKKFYQHNTRRNENFANQKYNRKNNNNDHSAKQSDMNDSKKKRLFYQDYQNKRYKKSPYIDSWFIRVGTPSSSSCEEDNSRPKYKPKPQALQPQIQAEQIKQHILTIQNREQALNTGESNTNAQPQALEIGKQQAKEKEQKQMQMQRQTQLQLQTQHCKLLKEISIDQQHEDNLLLTQTSEKVPQTNNELDELVTEQIAQIQIGQYIQMPKCSYQFGQNNTWKQNKRDEEQFEDNRKKKKRVYDANNSVNQEIKKKFIKEIKGKQFNEVKQSHKNLNLKYTSIYQINQQKQIEQNNNVVEVQPEIPVKQATTTKQNEIVDKSNQISQTNIKKYENQPKLEQKQSLNKSIENRNDEQSFTKYDYPTKNICFAFKKNKVEVMPEEKKKDRNKDMMLFYSSPIKYEPKIKKIQKWRIRLEIKAEAIENIIIHSFKYKNIKIKTKNKEVELNTSELKVLELDRKYSMPRNYQKNTPIEWNFCSLQALNKDNLCQDSIIILAVSVKCKSCHKNCDGEVDGNSFTKICECAQIVQFEILKIRTNQISEI